MLVIHPLTQKIPLKIECKGTVNKIGSYVVKTISHIHMQRENGDPLSPPPPTLCIRMIPGLLSWNTTDKAWYEPSSSSENDVKLSRFGLA